MIETVKQIKTVKAVDLPPTFDIQVGTTSYPFELDYMDYAYVYIIDMTSGETVYLRRSDMVTILVPDTLDNARMDIEMDLMQMGMI